MPKHAPPSPCRDSRRSPRWARRLLALLFYGAAAILPPLAGIAIPFQELTMVDATQIKEHTEVIGADGVHVGTVDHVEGRRIKLTRKDSGSGPHQGHHHYIDIGLVADIEGDRVRLSANAAVAVSFEEEKEGTRN